MSISNGNSQNGIVKSRCVCKKFLVSRILYVGSTSITTRSVQLRIEHVTFFFGIMFVMKAQKKVKLQALDTVDVCVECKHAWENCVIHDMCDTPATYKTGDVIDVYTAHISLKMTTLERLKLIELNGERRTTYNPFARIYMISLLCLFVGLWLRQTRTFSVSRRRRYFPTTARRRGISNRLSSPSLTTTSDNINLSTKDVTTSFEKYSRIKYRDEVDNLHPWIEVTYKPTSSWC